VSEQVTISRERYEALLEAQRILAALKGAGVDNWIGYDYALKELYAEEGDFG
jgi:hypothetical protein